MNPSELLSPDAPEGPLGHLRLRPDEWYEDQRVEVLTDAWVEHVDLEADLVDEVFLCVPVFETQVGLVAAGCAPDEELQEP